MKKQILLLVTTITLAFCSVSNASIVGAGWHDDGDNSVVCTNWAFSGNDTLSMTGVQCGSLGHMVGWIQTSDPLDPTLFLGSAVDNDTAGSWVSYQVNVVMNAPFTFSGTPSVSSIPSDGWFLASTTAPALQVSGPYAGQYEGTLNFSAGTPLVIGGELNFSYAINFASSTDYAFTQEMIPMFVPEPSILALTGIGGLLLALRSRRNRA